MEWTKDGLTFSEVVRQPYANDEGCYIAAGFVSGDPVDTIYLELSRGERQAVYLFRPDEVAAVMWCFSGVLWSLHIEDVPPIKE